MKVVVFLTPLVQVRASCVRWPHSAISEFIQEGPRSRLHLSTSAIALALSHSETSSSWRKAVRSIKAFYYWCFTNMGREKKQKTETLGEEGLGVELVSESGLFVSIWPMKHILRFLDGADFQVVEEISVPPSFAGCVIAIRPKHHRL